MLVFSTTNMVLQVGAVSRASAIVSLIKKNTEWGILFIQNLWRNCQVRHKPWVRMTKGFCLCGFWGDSGRTEYRTSVFFYFYPVISWIYIFMMKILAFIFLADLGFSPVIHFVGLYIWIVSSPDSMFHIPTGSAHRSVHGLCGFFYRRSDWLKCVQ